MLQNVDTGPSSLWTADKTTMPKQPPRYLVRLIYCKTLTYLLNTPMLTGNFNKCYWGGVPPTDNNKQIGQTSAQSVYQQPPRVYVGIVCAGLNYYLPVHTILCRETRVRAAVALLFVSVCRTAYKKEAVHTRTHTPHYKTSYYSINTIRFPARVSAKT